MPPTAQQIVASLPGRVTKPRIAVCDHLMHAQRPLSHTELQQALPQINRVSLYRALDWLEAAGVANHLIGSDGIRRYLWQEREQQHDHHAHFQCQQCGSTECLEDMPVNQDLVPPGYQVSTMSLIIHGTCASCSH